MKRRPLGIKVLSISFILFNSFILFGVAIILFTLPSLPTSAWPRLTEQMILFTIGLAGLASGVGVLMLKNWARRLMIFLGTVLILSCSAWLPFHLGFVKTNSSSGFTFTVTLVMLVMAAYRVLSTFQLGILRTQPAAWWPLMSRLTFTIFVIFVILNGVAVWYFLRPSVKAQFVSKGR